MRASLLSGMLLLFLVLPLSVQAQSAGLALHAGTRGIGGDVTVPVASELNVRVGGSYFAYGTDGSRVIEGVTVDWKGDSDIFFLSAFTDWHPFKNAFRLTGGIVYNGLTSDGSFRPRDEVQAGGTTYTPSEIGRVNATVDFDRKVAPYLGLGFGNSVRGSRVDFLLDLGLIYQGSPNVDLEATQMLTPTEGEAGQIEENISWARWYPVLSIGVSTQLF